MSDKLKKTLLGALVAVALAIAASYGLISQQTADNLQAKANQTLSTDPSQPPSTPQQSAPAPQNSGTQAPAPVGPTPRP